MSPKSHDTQQRLSEQINRLIESVGGDTGQLSGKLVREMIHTSVKLLRDGADNGELKLTSRSLKELRYALKVFRDYREARKIAIFGSARTPEDHPDYQAALAFSRDMARRGWMAITGAGGGIMRAGHGGAGRASSFGVAIRLPFETTANEFIEGDPKLIVFRYFFTRKLIFVSQSHAVALFPGGFGTMDEGFETLTLIQTGKAPLIPVVMIDAPGADYWQRWDRFVRDELLANGMISEPDLSLYHVTDQISEAVAIVQRFYRIYHSQRFVRDHLVLRLNRRLTDAETGTLNEQFSDLVVKGCIEQCDAQPTEKSHLELPRIRFISTRRDYGRLRQMIDCINGFDEA